MRMRVKADFNAIYGASFGGAPKDLLCPALLHVIIGAEQPLNISVIEDTPMDDKDYITRFEYKERQKRIYTISGTGNGRGGGITGRDKP